MNTAWPGSGVETTLMSWFVAAQRRDLVDFWTGRDGQCYISHPRGSGVRRCRERHPGFLGASISSLSEPSALTMNGRSRVIAGVPVPPPTSSARRGSPAIPAINSLHRNRGVILLLPYVHERAAAQPRRSG